MLTDRVHIDDICLPAYQSKERHLCFLNKRGTLRCQKVVQLSSVHGVATRRAQAKTLWDLKATWLFTNHKNVVPLTTVVIPFVGNPVVINTSDF